ncbi:hypothetical protein FMEAI12_5290039 [Parafrankia sp. Ea1.12]|nr:hypothetical protein FMEAI12_5290039 [Parafrankia sp. Ea1.12]
MPVRLPPGVRGVLRAFPSREPGADRRGAHAIPLQRLRPRPRAVPAAHLASLDAPQAPGPGRRYDLARPADRRHRERRPGRRHRCRGIPRDRALGGRRASRAARAQHVHADRRPLALCGCRDGTAGPRPVIMRPPPARLYSLASAALERHWQNKGAGPSVLRLRDPRTLPAGPNGGPRRNGGGAGLMTVRQMPATAAGRATHETAPILDQHHPRRLLRPPGRDDPGRRVASLLGHQSGNEPMPFSSAG